MFLLDKIDNFDIEKMFILLSNLHSLFTEKNDLTLTEIKKHLLEQTISHTEEELNYIMHDFFIKRGTIVRDDYWNQEPIYKYLEQRLFSSSYSKHYYSFNVDDNKTKKFLLIADTHIGNENIEDFKMLDKVYDYGIYKGAKKCFHLGDLFTGDINDEHLTKEEKLKQLKKFIDYYPKPNSKEMTTYGILGNNDLEIDNMLWHTGYSDIYYDLRELSFLNPSFYMIPRERFIADFLDKKFHFVHKFYHNSFIRNLKVSSEEDLLEYREWLDSEFDVQISGHLHNGFIYGDGQTKYTSKDILFLAVPATGKINLNKPVAYLVTLNYNDKGDNIPSMDISVLNCDSNYNIIESDNLTWYFNGNNDINKKIRRI